jgi:hypothetical protein
VIEQAKRFAADQFRLSKEVAQQRRSEFAPRSIELFDR